MLILVKKMRISLLILCLINLCFPLLGVVLISLYYFCLKLSDVERKIIFFNISFSMAFIGFLYLRTDSTGDVFRYGLALDYYKESIYKGGRISALSNIYELAYPTWYFIFSIVAKLKFSVQSINFLAGFTFYSSCFYLIRKLQERFRIESIDKILCLKLFLFVSFIVFYSSYKTQWAFSLINYGLFMLMNKKKIGVFSLLLGVGMHPIAWFPVIVYLISIMFKFKYKYLFFSIIIGAFFRTFVFLLDRFIEIPFIGNKINTYIHGEWSNYRFHDNGEYVKYFMLLVVIVLIFAVISTKMIDFKTKNVYLLKYNNFILYYFSFGLIFISFRTFETRIMLDGFIFFIPLFYQLFMTKNIYMKKISSLFVLSVWYLLIDIRTFNFTNNSFLIGSGFPNNLFESPIVFFLNNFK